MDVTEETLPAADGYSLGATIHRPSGTPARVALLVPATGVPRRFYRAYGRFLAQHGIANVAWDWRGIAGSRPRSLRGFAASMRDWATLDLGGAIEFAASRFPDVPAVAVAHSFGAQAIGLVPGAHHLRGLVAVASQSGYWGHYRRPWKYLFAGLWYAAMPLATHTLGYFPARAFGLGEDLPRDVALEWARWCRRPQYLGDWSGHARFSSPILALTFTDDEYAPPAAADALYDRYTGSRQTRRYIAPRELGVKRIGHFGFFRDGLVPALWHETADWLLTT